MTYIKATDFEKLVDEVLFQGVTANLPSSYYVGSGHGALPLASDSLATVVASESQTPGTGGYSRKQLTRNTTDFPTLAIVSGHWKVSSKLISWVATLDWPQNSDWIFLTDVATGTSGRFFGAVTLDAPFKLLSGDSFDDTFEYQDR